MTLLFAPNLSMLWTDLPLADRFEAAARAGFGAVELWWPGDDAAATLPGLTSRWKLWLALLNFDADLAARGWPGRPRVSAGPVAPMRCLLKDDDVPVSERG